MNKVILFFLPLLIIGCGTIPMPIKKMDSGDKVSDVTLLNRKGKIETGDGWYRKMDTDLWVQNDRLIHEKKNPVISKYHSYELGLPPNYKSIEGITISYKGEKYEGILIQSVDGQYEYQYIQEEWYNYKKARIYLIPDEQIKSLLEFLNESKPGSLFTLKTHPYVYTTDILHENWNEKLLFAKLSRNLREYSEGNSYSFSVMNRISFRFSDSTNKVEFIFEPSFPNDRYFSVDKNEWIKILK